MEVTDEVKKWGYGVLGQGSLPIINMIKSEGLYL